MTQTAERLVRHDSGGVLPGQLTAASALRLKPVQRLMLAVLDRALADFRTYGAVPTARGRRLFTEVGAWFHSPGQGPFDFETICHATGLDPDFVRKGLRSSTWDAGAGA